MITFGLLTVLTSQLLHLVYNYLVTDLIVIRIRRNMLRPTLGPSAESFVQNPLNAAFIGKGSVIDICGFSSIAYVQQNSMYWSSVNSL